MTGAKQLVRQVRAGIAKACDSGWFDLLPHEASAREHDEEK